MSADSYSVQLFQTFLFFVAGFAIVGGGMAANWLLRPSRPSKDKMETYECGEAPIGPGQFRLNIRFYTMALIFIIFDVEVVAILPPAVVFRNWIETGLGRFALIEIVLFVSILAIGLFYVWVKGDIDWIKDIPEAES